MSESVRFLVVKLGALGDVVRTSYVAQALRAKWGHRLRLSWVTSKASLPLLRFNPHIDDIWTGFDEVEGHHFDCVFSLDDERETLEALGRVTAGRLVGAYLDGGQPRYTHDASEWFDMGLLSRFGKDRADELKRLNDRGHGEIFGRMFGVGRLEPGFHGSARYEAWAREWLPHGRVRIGINPFAGGRWPSKELREAELSALVDSVLRDAQGGAAPVSVVLFGAGADRVRNQAIASGRASDAVQAVDTDESVLKLAAAIRQMDFLVTSDSLAMHLAIAQGIRTVAFFAPTSAAEIDDCKHLRKVISLGTDYCSYRKDARNDSITADRLVAELRQLRGRPAEG